MAGEYGSDYSKFERQYVTHMNVEPYIDEELYEVDILNR
jgi:hypothetical protein